MIKPEFELILFGGLGDLASRKLLPALYFLQNDGRLGAGHIHLVTRQIMSQAELVDKVKEACLKYIPAKFFIDDQWQEFAQRLNYICLDATKPEQFSALKESLLNKTSNRAYYLATGSNLYMPICEGLKQAGLIEQESKVVLEKPIGHDYDSAQRINATVKEYFTEKQIYRIDHYLGKETVQNLLVLRFANSIFEHQWNQKYIDHIQITISETLGVENRAGFYDSVGAMRDMLQNHLLQLLCMTAMEPPAKLEADSIRDEKVKVLKALKPIEAPDISTSVVCGQYAAGVSKGEPVPKYRDEPGVAANSSTETFVAVKVEIENWRWAGVPFYLRTGKRLPEKACEIVVTFKEIPYSFFPLLHKNTLANKLTFRLQPDEGIRLSLCEKRVGPGMNVQPMNLSLNPTDAHQTRVPEAYERLLHDVLTSNQTLFLRDDELLEAWRWIDPMLSFWKNEKQEPETYTSGSWGPAAATLLLARDGRLWNEST